MRKSTKVIKKALATFLVVLMSIESFAAVVGDNDGAAFITKAEFDSMKNDFQSQLDRYNSSLDNKIDGAIASYLSGVKVAKKQTVKPEFPGTDILVVNLDKIDDLKFGSMDFKLSASSMNFSPKYLMESSDETYDRSAGTCAMVLERVRSDHGQGFEVFRVDKRNCLDWSRDTRFEFTAARNVVSHTSSGWTFYASEILGRWHASFNQKLTPLPDNQPFTPEANGEYAKFRPYLSEPSWLSFWQTGGVGFQCSNWQYRRGTYDIHYGNYNPAFDSYQASVVAYNIASASTLICDDGQSGTKSNIFCCFSGDTWSPDLITQRDDLYDLYVTNNNYKYDTPDDAGLTRSDAVTWTQPDWRYFYDLSTNADGTYKNYLRADIKHSLVRGVTWVTYGKYNQKVGSAPSQYQQGTSAPFYEMIPKLNEKDLNVLKCEDALSNVSDVYNGWSGFIYQGLPLINLTNAGQVNFDLDLTDAEEDLIFAINTASFPDNKSVRSFTSTSLSSLIDSWSVDGSSIANAGCQLTAGDTHKISIKTNGKTSLFYKIVPADSDSKKRNKVVLPKTIVVESES